MSPQNALPIFTVEKMSAGIFRRLEDAALIAVAPTLKELGDITKANGGKPASPIVMIGDFFAWKVIAG